MSSYFTVQNCVRVMLFIFVLAVPLVFVFAQAQTQTNQPLVPCEGTLGTKGCTAKMLTMLFMNIINFLIVLAAILGTLMLVFSGIAMVTANGNKSKIEHSKETFKNVVIGLILVLAAWTIVDTFMKIMVGENLMGGGNWYTVPDAKNPDLRETPVEPVSGAAVTPSGIPPLDPEQMQQNAQGANDGSAGTGPNGNNTPATRPGDAISADAARARLAAAGIQSNQVQTGVDLQNVSQARIDQIAKLAEQCSLANGGTATSNACNVSVSSGFRAGTGQSNHGTGDAVDISGRSTTFNNWMNSQSTGQSAFGGHSTVTAGGGSCTYHPNESGGGMHWHCSSNGR